METIQDQKGITLLLRQLQWGRENAQDIKIVISQAQLDSGLTEPILEETKTWTPYIEEDLILRLDCALGGWYQTARHIQYDEYRTRIKFFQRQDNGFRRYVENKDTNYFIEDGMCEALPLAAHPAESTRTPRNNLQAVHPYSTAELPSPPTDDLPEVHKTDKDYIH